jgi:toxin FitB
VSFRVKPIFHDFASGMIYLLDTNVISELRKLGRPAGDANVARWATETTSRNMRLSAVTIEELEIGVLRMERRDPTQGNILRAWLTGSVLRTFASRIFPVDESIALESARFHVPNPRPIRDAFIAATALLHGMTVATWNVADFEPMGISVFNPWEP